MTTDKTFLESYEHGDIKEIITDIYFVTGSMVIEGRLPMSFSRNMTIIKDDGDLTLVNSVRLSESGLTRLDQLGRVKNVIRLAGFHGMDDPFYKSRYDAKVWSVNAPYVSGIKIDPDPQDYYFQPDVVLDEAIELPINNAEIIHFKSCKPHELLLFLKRDNGIIISGDCLQNWGETDIFFSLFAKVIMRIMGYIKPYNVGPGWLKYAKPDTNEVKNLLEFDFQHVLPAHGTPVINDAKELFKPAILKI